jgi:hypothetical protein
MNSTEAANLFANAKSIGVKYIIIKTVKLNRTFLLCVQNILNFVNEKC